MRICCCSCSNSQEAPEAEEHDSLADTKEAKGKLQDTPYERDDVKALG